MSKASKGEISLGAKFVQSATRITHLEIEKCATQTHSSITQCANSNRRAHSDV